MKKLQSAIELHGPPCSGKSTFLRSVTGTVFTSWKPILYYFILGLCYLILKNRKGLYFIYKHSTGSDKRYLFRLRAFLHCVCKFSFFRIQHLQVSFIDEGISQIPYILCLQNDAINDFFMSFSVELNSFHFMSTKNLSIDEIEKRLALRGHKKTDNMTVTDRRDYIRDQIRIHNMIIRLET